MIGSLKACVLAIGVGVPAFAWSHVSDLPHAEPGWTLTPSILLPLALSLVLFAVGSPRVLQRSHLGRGGLRRRVLLFSAGWFTLAAAAISPLHEAGESSFTLHMLEHELLMLLAAPLLVLARPLEIMLWSLPSRARRTIGSWVRSRVVQRSWKFSNGAVTATVLQAAALWLWHVPTAFEMALAYDGWHIAQHLSFLLTALLFWSAMFQGDRQRLGTHAQSGRALAVLCLFATSIVSGALGALMAFSQSPWYPRYAALGLAPFGLTPIEDQQLAGLLMWIPGGLVHAVVALLLLGGLLRDSAARSPEILADRNIAARNIADSGSDLRLPRLETDARRRAHPPLVRSGQYGESG